MKNARKHSLVGEVFRLFTARSWPVAMLFLSLGCDLRSESRLPTIRVQEAGAGLKIDGILSSGEWGGRAFQFGEKAESGAVFMTWNPKGLAMAFTARETTPVYGGFKEGTSLHKGDLFEVFIDPVGDHRQYYEIQVDPSGRTHVINHVLSAEAEVTETLRFTESFLQREMWSCVLSEVDGMRVKSGIDGKGRWTLELFFPASGFLGRRLGRETLKRSSLRANFCHVDTLKNGDQKVFTWARVESGCQHISPQAMGWVYLVK